MKRLRLGLLLMGVVLAPAGAFAQQTTAPPRANPAAAQKKKTKAPKQAPKTPEPVAAPEAAPLEDGQKECTGTMNDPTHCQCPNMANMVAMHMEEQCLKTSPDQEAYKKCLAAIPACRDIVDNPYSHTDEQGAAKNKCFNTCYKKKCHCCKT